MRCASRWPETCRTLSIEPGMPPARDDVDVGLPPCRQQIRFQRDGAHRRRGSRRTPRAFCLAATASPLQAAAVRSRRTVGDIHVRLLRLRRSRSHARADMTSQPDEVADCANPYATAAGDRLNVSHRCPRHTRTGWQMRCHGHTRVQVPIVTWQPSGEPAAAPPSRAALPACTPRHRAHTTRRGR